MNEIKKCSIGGISFTLEHDAYDVLSTYIDSLQESYKDDPDGAEILADIEARIAELILSTQPTEGIVARPLIENIIKQLGSPQEIEDEDNQSKSSHSTEHSDLNGNPRIPRRLYRDLENSKLGGVCAGFAKYFGIDPTLLRLSLFIPLLLSTLGTIHIVDGLHFHLSLFMGNLFAWIVVAYIVMWFVVPPASSARQKLEQNGERITAQGIKTNTQGNPDDRERTLVAKIVMTIGNIMLVMLKIFAIMMLVGLIVGGSVICLVALCAIPVIAFDFATGLALLSFFFVALIPIFTLIYLAIMFISTRKPNGKAMIVILILWIISLSTMTVAAIKSKADFSNMIDNTFESVFENDPDLLYEEFSEEEVEEFRRRVGAQENDTVTRTHVMGNTTMTLSGDTNDVKELEANIKFGGEGIQISENGKSVLRISTDGIVIDDEQIATFEKGKNRFTMNIGGVKIDIHDADGDTDKSANN